MSRPRNEGPRCTVADCDKPAAPKRELCEGHHKRKVRGQRIDTPLRGYANPARALMEAAFAFADAAAEDDAEYRRAWVRLRKAAKRY